MFLTNLVSIHVIQPEIVESTNDSWSKMAGLITSSDFITNKKLSFIQL